MFYLDSVDSIDEFKTQVESMFETDDFSSIDARVVTSADEFNSIGGPIVNMKKVGSIIVQGSLLATTLIVSLILILVIRDRRKEIGIYLAMGESSFKVIALQFTAILVITSIAFCLSLLTSKILAERLAESMLSGQRKFIEETMDDAGSHDLQTDVLDEYVIVIDSAVYVDMFALVLGILCISIVPMAIDIIKTNPKKILM